MAAIVVQGDATHLPLPDDSVDLICTSPPYFALRSYRDGGAHLVNQVGAEATPAEYISTLLTCTREWMRVLKPSGSMWVNLGDSYAGSGKGPQGRGGQRATRSSANAPSQAKRPDGWSAARSKSLMGLPWRYAIGCIDQLGLILRAEVIWDKINPLPESVTDRVRRSHEQWFHFTMQPRYFSAVDTIREPHIRPLTAMQMMSNSATPRGSARHSGTVGVARSDSRNSTDVADYTGSNPLGKLPGSVWPVATQPLKVPAELGIEHFAAFPMEFPRRIISGWSPSGICTACREGRRPVSARELTNNRKGRQHQRGVSLVEGGDVGTLGYERIVTITGEACGCTPYVDHPGEAPTFKPWREYHFIGWTPPPTTQAVVLDPLGGTGTVALMADVLGRTGITVDLSFDYCRLATWRTTDPKQRARAMRAPKAKVSLCSSSRCSRRRPGRPSSPPPSGQRPHRTPGPGSGRGPSSVTTACTC